MPDRSNELRFNLVIPCPWPQTPLKISTKTRGTGKPTTEPDPAQSVPQIYYKGVGNLVPRGSRPHPMSKHTNNLPLLAALIVGCVSGAAAQATAQAAGNFDGPAELPRVYVKSSIADTPAPGKVWRLKEGDSIQKALSRAACGDMIELQPAATFDGSFELPSKSCDDSHWIILRTGSPDSSLPAEGTRISPCYAGVASLPGRPAYAMRFHSERNGSHRRIPTRTKL